MADDREWSLYGDTAHLIREVLGKMASDNLSAEDAVEIVAAMAGHGDRHDISVPFRVAMIAMGHEDKAMHVAAACLIMVNSGVVFGFQLNKNETWFDEPESQIILKQATVLVMRAGNIDASLGNDGEFRIHGKITERNIDKIVEEFRTEIDREFPTAPKPREGKWW